MKYLASLVLMVFLTIGCANEKKSKPAFDPGAETTTTTTTQPINPATTPPATPPTAEPAQNADGVWHYTCPNGCTGGAGAAGPCATCGTQLTHNAAYHANTSTTTTNPTINMEQNFTPPPTTPEPAQNANGVWHYTCPNGCAGGAGVAQPCGSCGTQLTHNAAYHQG
jgi:hypothetical protein